MKIVYVLENYLPHIGGVEVLFKHICESLAKKHKVVVVTHRLPGTKKREKINGVEIIRINVPHFGSRYFYTILSIPTLLDVCKDADIIHTTTYNGAPPARLISAIYKKPSLITIHEVIGKNWHKLLEMNWLSGKLHQFLEWLVISLKFDKYVTVSYSTKRDFEDVKKKKKSVVIYNGIDYNFWDPEKYNGKKIRKKLGLEHKFVYFFFGRPGPSKGFEHLVKAVPMIKENIKEGVLVAVLSRNKAYERRYQKIKEMISGLGIKQDIILLKPVPRDELPSYVKAADCVVVPSITEGFGFSVAESCAMGKPVVASNTTSIPEVISGEYVLVKPKNAKEIAKGVVEVFGLKAKRTKLKKFTWDKCIGQYEALYKDLIKKNLEKSGGLSKTSKKDSKKTSKQK